MEGTRRISHDSGSGSSVEGASSTSKRLSKTSMRTTFQESNPFGTNGMLTHVAEHIPFLNNGIQEIHRSQGEMSALQRARTRNPVGADGLITQVGEHIPLVCDGIEALHRVNGQDLAAERASARTLPRLFSRDGPVTKVAELFPGTNLLAAMLHEFHGNHDEAVRALNLFDNWTQVGEPDGPLAKVAELVPGMDCVAFGLHVSAGEYPQALRSITKTKWVNVEIKFVSIWISSHDTTVQNIEVTTSKIRNLEVFPKVLSLIVGMNDLMTSYLELDKMGKLRPRIRRRFSTISVASGSSSHFEESPEMSNDSIERRHSRVENDDDVAIVGVETEELLSNFVQNILSRIIRRMTEDVPLYVELSLDIINGFTIPRWRREQLRYRLVFKPTLLPMFPDSFGKALQEAFPRASLTHEPLPSTNCRVLLPPLRLSRRKRNDPELALAVCGLGAAGLCSGKVAAFACFGGLLAGTAVMCRSAFRFLHNHFNTYNVESWEPAALRIDPNSRLEGYQQPEQNAVVCELEKSDAAYIIDIAVNHIIESIRCSCIAAPLFRCVKPVLKAIVRQMGSDWETIPFVMDVDIGDLNLEVEAWPNGLKLPNLRVALLFDINLAGNGLSQVRAIIPDTLVEEIFDSFRRQIQELDLRSMDTRLSGFTEPLRLNFNLNIRWIKADEVKLELTNLKSTLHLPD